MGCIHTAGGLFIQEESWRALRAARYAGAGAPAVPAATEWAIYWTRVGNVLWDRIGAEPTLTAARSRALMLAASGAREVTDGSERAAPMRPARTDARMENRS